MKKIIFTINFNAYDSLKIPKKVNDDSYYLCFTDNQYLTSDFWTMCVIKEDLDPHVLARKIFINSIEYISKIKSDFEESLMIGGQIQPIKKVSWNKNLQDVDMAVKEHPTRRCVFDEAIAVLEGGKTDLKQVLPQMARYMKEGMPKRFGLWETGIMFRKNNPTIKKFEELWWNEYLASPTRDQLSFPYAVWKMKDELKIRTLDKSILTTDENSDFKIYCHDGKGMVKK